MKRYKIVVGFVILIFAGCMILCGGLLKGSDVSVDAIELNDIVKSAEEKIDHLEALDEENFSCDFVIFGVNNEILYQTRETELESLYDAIAKNYPHMCIESNGVLIGEAVMLDGISTQVEQVKYKTFAVILGTMILLLLVMIGYGVFVRRSIIVPFQNMQEFANEIAAGNLDIALIRDKENLFGAFTESFDIMREELAAAREREINLKKREKEMIAGLSHDLKTPVTGIKLTSELLKVKATDAYTREKMGSIYEKAEQIDTLVSDLFASTLNELGEMKVNLRAEESGVLSDIVNRYDDNELCTIGELPECILSVDSRRMEQVISNCIRNSYKYANTRIAISYHLTGGYLQMDIRDYGSGVAEEELALVTGKFYRGKSEEVEMQEGSGLGLYIAKNLMERMGGELLCANANPGFQVSLMIPLD
ncbi:MAG: HAMP domain-containing sensor histidine kinase [bacterium]|nr:HAMP domain-containing sensor histidine kinase [bacterium]